MRPDQAMVNLTAPEAVDRTVTGGKAAMLARLSAAGFPVPPGVVVIAEALDDPRLDAQLEATGRRLGGERFAVRSSGAAEDLPDASFAGLYETYLDVPVDALGEAVRRCFAAADRERVVVYRDRRGFGGATAAMAVLVQVMIEAVAAGVAFTAHPVTGDRAATLVTAVAGPGDPLVSGEATGEEWTVTTGAATMTRPAPAGVRVLTNADAVAVADLARRVAERFDDRPQDVEWALDRSGTLWLLQSRPMTALPQPVAWSPPGPGLWMRNFRLGEWLPEAVTPLFATWLLPVLEDGYLDGMHHSLGVQVPFRYALVNGWYYNAPPVPSPRLLGRVLWHGRTRAAKILYNALIRVGRDPAGADRATLSELAREWRERQVPRYRRLVAEARDEAGSAPPQRLVRWVDALGREAGIFLWYLAIVGGSAWKMELCLTRFARRHLSTALPETDGGAQVLLRGLTGTATVATGHAVQSVDWYHPVAAELPGGEPPPASAGDRHRDLTHQRLAAERHCSAALTGRPGLEHDFERLLRVSQRYAVIREEQAHQFTLAWPVLRTCARRLGRHLARTRILDQPDDVFFATRDEIQAALAGRVSGPIPGIAERREIWQRQRQLRAPLTLGRPVRLIGDVIDHAVREARGTADVADGAIVGHPASAGRATGPVRVVHGPEDFAGFADGDVLVAKATAPAWTPLFVRAAAVVTDGGTLAAHASLVAREYGIPAVVGTGDATHRLHTGQIVSVDGTTGTVTPMPSGFR
jgi:phosphohistidine swiveling domain-containing protein